ncbi:MAG: hypothetical protein NXI28_00190 [bacterium]|nr:hypothetical protein [bacterium]
MDNKTAAKWVRLGERFSEIAKLDNNAGREELPAANARGGSLLRESIELGFISLGEQNSEFLAEYFRGVQARDRGLWQFAHQSLFLHLIGDLTKNANPHGFKLGPISSNAVASRSSGNWRMQARNYSEACFDIAEKLESNGVQIAAEEDPQLRSGMPGEKIPSRLVKPLTEYVLRALHATGEPWSSGSDVVKFMKAKFGVGSKATITNVLKENEDLKAWTENRSVSHKLYGDIQSAVGPGLATEEDLRAAIVEEVITEEFSDDDRKRWIELAATMSREDLMELSGMRS